MYVCFLLQGARRADPAWPKLREETTHDPDDALACIAACPLIEVWDVLQYRFPQPATLHVHASSADMSTSRRRFLLPLRDV